MGFRVLGLAGLLLAQSSFSQPSSEGPGFAQLTRDKSPRVEAVTGGAVAATANGSRAVVNTHNLPGEVNWIWASFGTIIGTEVMDAADVDADGSMELLVTGGGRDFIGPSTLFVLEDDLETVACVFHPLPYRINDYKIYQADEDPNIEVLLVMRDSTMLIDAAECALQKRYYLPFYTYAAALGDVDADGVPDVVYEGDGDLFVAPWNDFSSPVARYAIGPDELVVGSLTRGTGDDVGFRDEGGLRVLRGDTLEDLAEYPEVQTTFFDFGDVDGDGFGEIVGFNNSGDRVEAFNPGDPEPIFSTPVGWAQVMRLQDTDQDGDDEIVFGLNGSGTLKVVEGDGSIEYSIDDAGSASSAVLVTDLDSDDEPEAYWADGADSTGGDYLTRASLPEGVINWRNYHYIPSFHLVDADAQSISLMFEDTGATGTGGGIVELDRATGQQTEVNLGLFPSSTDSLATAINDELKCFSTERGPEHMVRCFGASSDELIWEWEHSIGHANGLFLLELDGDGQTELLAVHTSGVITALSADTGAVEWELQGTGLGVWNVPSGFDDVALIDGDLWVVGAEGELRVLDPATGSVLRSESEILLTQIATHGGKVYGVRDGEGVGVLDRSTLGFTELLYASSEPLQRLDISDDGTVLMTAVEEWQEDARPVLLSPEGLFSPWEVGVIQVRDALLFGDDELILATSFGVMSVSLSEIDYFLMRDRFEGQ